MQQLLSHLRSSPLLPQIRMPRPDTEGRYEILRLQLTSKNVAPDVDLLQLARDLPGLVGADLANIVNEAQLNCKHLIHAAGTDGCLVGSWGAGRQGVRTIYFVLNNNGREHLDIWVNMISCDPRGGLHHLHRDGQV
jgi:hypothetical protein